MLNRTETAAHCVLVACDRRLARRGNPLLNNLQACDRLHALGFRIVRSRDLHPAFGRGDDFEAVYVHPDCGFAVAYVTERWADGTFWRVERRPLPL